MRVSQIPALHLDSYQRAVRLVLTHHLVTERFPDHGALPLVRRWATELREDLFELFGYRLEVTETTARLFTVRDRVDPAVGARTGTDRAFDRRRYAYLALCLAALGRAGAQITLSELASHVASEASRVDGVDLVVDRAADRDAFVDAVGWLAARGAIALADGDAGRWAGDPDAGEALYDVDRAVLAALFRPARPLQHVRSVRELLDDPRAGRPDDAGRTRALRRAVLDRPVVYADDLSEDDAVALARPATARAVAELTGLALERRREGVALIDTSGRFSDVRFPATGTVSQVALLLAVELADAARELRASGAPGAAMPLADDRLLADVDSALPRSTVFAALADPDSGHAADPRDPGPAPAPRDEHPLVSHAWIADTVATLADRFGHTFAAAWQADPAGLAAAALDVLDRHRLVARVTDGVLVLPAIARFRDAVVTVRDRDPHLFAPEPTTSEAPSVPSDPDTSIPSVQEKV